MINIFRNRNQTAAKQQAQRRAQLAARIAQLDAQTAAFGATAADRRLRQQLQTALANLS